MPGKTSKQVVAKTETPVELKTETPVAPVVAAPVVAAPVQKGGKKVTKVVEAKQVEPVAPAAPVAPAQKGGKKVTKVQATETPVSVAPVVAPVAQKGGKKAATPKVAATKKAVEKKPVAKKVKVEKTETVEGDEEASGDRRIRSFKVRLPNSETFEGRFTGLTPYQAANKALSKYFRETEHPKVEISFSICESTRKSKKSVYTYVGKRHQLEVPVTYKIADGREIVKNFKNSLKKVKKSEAVTESA